MKLPNLGIMGKMGSGKGFASKYLVKKYGYKVISMGNIVRAIAKKEKMKPTRENLEKLQKKYSNNGKDFVIERVIEKANSIKGPVILDGIRKPLQAKFAKEKLNAILIDVYAAPTIRFERMKKRRRANFPDSFKKFKESEKKEENVFHINKALKMADFKVNNDDGAKRLYMDLDSIMRRLK
ncbi:MAG: AAA family ATPase [Nanoarchaeota archaeon]|nr:AAA family ATPase [Nanoarchaeota archaeon]